MIICPSCKHQPCCCGHFPNADQGGDDAEVYIVTDPLLDKIADLTEAGIRLESDKVALILDCEDLKRKLDESHKREVRWAERWDQAKDQLTRAVELGLGRCGCPNESDYGTQFDQCKRCGDLHKMSKELNPQT